jgi:PAS domain S-box-containing protein
VMKQERSNSPRQPEQTLETLKERADKYQSIFENSALGIFQSTPEGRFLSVNPAFAKIFGYDSPEEMIASIKDISDQFYLQPERRREILAAIEAKDGTSRFDADFRGKGGTIITVALSVRAVRDSEGRVSHLDGFIEDVTEARLREKEVRQHAEHLSHENVRLRASMKERYRFGEILGKSAVMQDVYESMLQAAATDVSVIIYGESGTGKELVARGIHDLSRRHHREFVPVNCGAIPEHLLESEFFGHKKGAFTGAHADTHGYLDLADGGTLFLDEVSELGLEMQVKLLRAIEGRGYSPVGDSRTRKSDFRVIAATNRDIKEMVRGGKMREDFYFRIHIIPVTMPPLRARRDDIPLLVDHFLRQFSGSGEPPALPGRVLDSLYRYDWPGNIRELQNVLRRYLATKRLDFLAAAGEDLTKDVPREAGESLTLPQMVSQYEKSVIEKVLDKHHWHRGRTAAALGIDRKTLFTKMKTHGLA